MNKEDQQSLDTNGFWDSTGRYYVSVQAIGYDKINLGFSGKYIAWDVARIEIECLGFPLPAGYQIIHRMNVNASDKPEHLFLLTRAEAQQYQQYMAQILSAKPEMFGELVAKLHEAIQNLSNLNMSKLKAEHEFASFSCSPRQEKSDDSLIMFCDEPEERLL